MPKNKRIGFVVNHAAFFVSHRLPLAVEARKAGFDVCLLTGRAGSGEMERTAMRQLEAAGVAHWRVAFTTSGVNPIIELLGLLQLVYFFCIFKPDIVHCASPKGVLYGGMIARLAGVPGLVLAISGMGYAYTDATTKIGLRALARRVYSALARLAFHHRNVRVIVQNREDYQFIIDTGLANTSSLRLIKGSGVDLSLFEGCASNNKSKIVLLPARLLKDKGVEEFVEAARRLKPIAPDWRFVLAGAAGYDNPTAICLDQIHSWVTEGCIEWLGHVEDPTALFRQAAIVCLPSYREGMPKVLLEASAAACAVVTTDVIGCREAIEPGVTGELVPARDSNALGDALLSLINDEKRRKAYGEKGVERASRLFSITSVVDQTMAIYSELLTYA